MLKFKDVDIFGQQINLTYENRTHYKTTLGASATLFMILTMLGYSANSFVSVVRNEALAWSITRKTYDLDADPGLENPHASGFEMAFGFNGKTLPKSMGRWIVRYMNNSDAVDIESH